MINSSAQWQLAAAGYSCILFTLTLATNIGFEGAPLLLLLLRFCRCPKIPYSNFGELRRQPTAHLRPFVQHSAAFVTSCNSLTILCAYHAVTTPAGCGCTHVALAAFLQVLHAAIL
jgi:hypothetical protein